MGNKSYVTAKSLAFLRARGEFVEVTEHYVSRNWTPKGGKKPIPGFRKDLFGFADIAGFDPFDPFAGGGTSYYQITTGSHVAARIKKMREVCAIVRNPKTGLNEQFDLMEMILRCGNLIYIHGWRKKKNRWILREIEITDSELRTPKRQVNKAGYTFETIGIRNFPTHGKEDKD